MCIYKRGREGGRERERSKFILSIDVEKLRTGLEEVKGGGITGMVKSESGGEVKGGEVGGSDSVKVKGEVERRERGEVKVKSEGGAEENGASSTTPSTVDLAL